ncbi:MAG: electron transfer flavoprotein subunit alpha [Kiritimatiellia bacterium]
MSDILLVLHTESDGSFSKSALESITSAADFAAQSGTPFDAAVMGVGAAAAADMIAGCGAQKIYVVEDDAVSVSRYATDVKAVEALIRASGAHIILAPGTSRFVRCMPGAAFRTDASIDTHIVDLQAGEGSFKARRWYYRQRILTTFTRETLPCIMLLDGGVNSVWEGEAGSADKENISVDFGDAVAVTTVEGVESPAVEAQTIRPDAPLLFVAGAGWTKKQSDGECHVGDAGVIIQGFLGKANASLGSSKSLVDLQTEGQETLSFMSHMNQIGQTGSTPRHAKGLSTCCHGEEPHAVGWRFINERRAINLDTNCGWAQGKADVVYIGDAFEIITKVNALLG